MSFQPPYALGSQVIWLALLQHSLYCGDLELNLQYLQGMPVHSSEIELYIYGQLISLKFPGKLNGGK